jgi:hypothetical protein
VGKLALGQVCFPYQFLFHQKRHTHLSSLAATIGQLVVDVPSGLSLTTLKETKKEEKLVEESSFREADSKEIPQIFITLFTKDCFPDLYESSTHTSILF